MDEMELRLASRKMIQAERALRIQAMNAAAEAERLANTDKLTGLGNRRALDMISRATGKGTITPNWNQWTPAW